MESLFLMGQPPARQGPEGPCVERKVSLGWLSVRLEDCVLKSGDRHPWRTAKLQRVEQIVEARVSPPYGPHLGQGVSSVFCASCNSWV